MRMPTKSQVEKYLSSVTSSKINVSYFGPLSDYEKEPERGGDIKTLGYGVPYLVVYKQGGQTRRSIVSTMRISRGFGHDYRSDRIDNLVLSYDTWNRLPKHSKIQDIGAFKKKDSSMLSLGDADEFFLLRPMIDGVEYYKDLDRIFSTGNLQTNDVPRAHALADYLAVIHSKKNEKKEDKELYLRKIRDTLGHGECIFGLADSYPESTDFLTEGELAELEKKCVEHRWSLRKNTSRLSQVHGDFHPWNVLFSKDKKRPLEFRLLDRSRGEWGEPADDLCAMSINYIFYSLRKYGEFKGEYAELFNEFLNTYMKKTGDTQIFDAMPLFYTFRALVIASPLWYPTLSRDTRRKIFNFAHNILEERRFDPARVNDYLMWKN
ncbi:MAG: aminoglycoside phosphotransferase family protein [Nitrososphaerota archaeon]|nr:aminoglycoside phosphotransferase family protein [Nitrososphaerota archaeon]